MIAAALHTSMLVGCVGHHLNRDTHETVRMTYVHVANVYQLATADGALSPQGQDDRGFWAVFDICSIDIQGMNLKGFTLDVQDFYVAVGDQRYDADRPYRVLSTFNSDVDAKDEPIRRFIAERLGLAPEQQYFPKESYPTLAYRLVVAIPEWPQGYLGKSMTLGNSDPETTLINVSEGSPREWQQYDQYSSGPLTSTCPKRNLPRQRKASVQP
jgi:hypothetical protein